MVGQLAVVHLLAENIYVSLTLTSWAQGGGGGLSYIRTTLSPVPEPSILLLFAISGQRAMPAICGRNGGC